MFALVDIKEYWCIVSINDRKDEVRIVRYSPDLLESDWIDSDDLEYNVIYWDQQCDQAPGLYRLTLEPTYEDKDFADQEAVFDSLRTAAFEVLYTL